MADETLKRSWAEIITAGCAAAVIVVGLIVGYVQYGDRIASAETRILKVEGKQDETDKHNAAMDQKLHDILCAVDPSGRPECVRARP